MTKLYLNDTNGLKEARLGDTHVENSKELQKNCIDFLCENLIVADPAKTFFAQSTSAHVANISRLIKRTSPHLTTLYISDHEIRWIKEMLEIPGYQPDSTRSNYRANEPVHSETFDLRMFAFHELIETINKAEGPAIFYVSHASRLTGELTDIAAAFALIKRLHPESLFIVDGAQTLGALSPFTCNEVCDVYLSMSCKFLGAEPNIGLAFMSDDFYERYVGRPESYPVFDIALYSRDIFSLWQNLQHPRFREDYQTHIESLKSYAVEQIMKIDSSILHISPSQAPNFLTLNLGSVDDNKKFVAYAEKEGVQIDDNVNPLWSLIDPPVPLVRIGLSVRAEKEDVDRLVRVVESYKQKTPR